MKTLLLVPVVLSLVLLGAHSLRAGCLLGVLGVLVVLVVLMVRRPWAARVVQAVLVLGALEWTRTLLVLASQRTADNEPVMRLVVILGTVAAVSIGSALVFQTRTMAKAYRLDSRPGRDQEVDAAPSP